MSPDPIDIDPEVRGEVEPRRKLTRKERAEEQRRAAVSGRIDCTLPTREPKETLPVREPERLGSGSPAV